MHAACEPRPRVAWGRETQSTVWMTGVASGVEAAADADEDARGTVRCAPALDAALEPAGGETRSTWPTSIASGFGRLFQRTMLDTDCRLLRAIL